MSYMFNSNSGPLSIEIDGGQMLPLSFNGSFMDLTKTRFIETNLSLNQMSKDGGKLLLYQRNDPHQSISVKIDTSVAKFDLRNALHCHDYFEILFVVKGSVEMQIETRTKTYVAGNVILLNRNIRHAEEKLKDGTTIIYLCISKDYLLSWPKADEQLLRPNNIMTRFFRNNLESDVKRNKDYIEYTLLNHTEPAPPISGILSEIMQELQLYRPGYMLVLRGMIFRLLSQLNDSTQYSFSFIDLGCDRECHLAHETKHYLDNTKRHVTRGELSEVLHYNGDYINRIFKKHIGCSIKEYNQKVFMTESLKMLAKTDVSVQEIISLLGVVNKTHFYSLFNQHFGTTPSAYRQNHVIDNQKDPTLEHKL